MFSKKYVKLLSCLLVLLLVLAGCGSNTQNTSNEGNEGNENKKDEKKETITLKLATFMPVEHPWTKAVTDPFMERVTELTDGQVQFEYFPAQQLGKAQDLMSLTADGVADIGMLSNIYYPSEMPLASALTGMPGLFENAEHGAVAYLKVAQQSPMLDTDFLKNGVRPLLTTLSPGYDFFTQGKQIKVPGDLKGLRIRAGGGVLTELLNYAGGTPVQMTVADAFSAFDKGVIEGLHAYYTMVENFGMGELVKYSTYGVNSGGGPSSFVINENRFQGLPKDVQDALLQAGEEMTVNGGKAEQENNVKFFEKMKATDGITVHELTKEEKQEWNELYEEFTDFWIKKQNSEDFKKVYELFKAEVEKQQ